MNQTRRQVLGTALTLRACAWLMPGNSCIAPKVSAVPST